MKVISLISRKYYFNLIIFVCLTLIVSFLAKNGVVPYFLKLLSFLVLVAISIFFLPISLLFDIRTNMTKKHKFVEIFSKLIFGISIALMGMTSFIHIEPFLFLFKIIFIIGSIFSFYLLFQNNPEIKGMFLSHFLLNFFLLGVIHMF